MGLSSGLRGQGTGCLIDRGRTQESRWLADRKVADDLFEGAGLRLGGGPMSVPFLVPQFVRRGLILGGLGGGKRAGMP